MATDDDTPTRPPANEVLNGLATREAAMRERFRKAHAGWLRARAANVEKSEDRGHDDAEADAARALCSTPAIRPADIFAKVECLSAYVADLHPDRREVVLFGGLAADLRRFIPTE